jgi:hypothetical protein
MVLVLVAEVERMARLWLWVWAKMILEGIGKPERN